MRPGGNDSGGGSRAGRGSAHALVIPAGDTSDGGFPSALTRGRGRRATASSAAVVLLADRGVAFGPPLGRSHSGGPRLITCQPRFARWGGTTPHTPRVPAYPRRDRVAPNRRTETVRGSRQLPPRLPASDFRLPTVLISLASLGWGDDPPYPPSVGVLARWAGRVSQSTGAVSGSRRSTHQLHLPPTTYHFRLPTSDFRLQ